MPLAEHRREHLLDDLLLADDHLGQFGLMVWKACDSCWTASRSALGRWLRFAMDRPWWVSGLQNGGLFPNR